VQVFRGGETGVRGCKCSTFSGVTAPRAISATRSSVIRRTCVSRTVATCVHLLECTDPRRARVASGDTAEHVIPGWLAGWLADSTARCTGAAAFTFVRTAETDYRQPALFADGRDRTLHPRICPPVRLMV